MLSKEQYKLLKFLNKKPIELEQLTSRFGSCLYLDKLDLITFETISNPSEFKKYAVITESGKAYVYTHRKESLAKWIPYTITTVIAVAAFIKSFFA